MTFHQSGAFRPPCWCIVIKWLVHCIQAVRALWLASRCIATANWCIQAEVHSDHIPPRSIQWLYMLVIVLAVIHQGHWFLESD